MNSILYKLLKLIKISLEILPLKFILFIGSMLGKIAYYLVPGRRRITVNNLISAFPEKDTRWCRLYAKKVFSNFGRNMMEFIKFSSGRIFNLVEVEGIEKFNDGAILLTGHLGNWEITGMSIAASGRELYPVGRRIHNPAFDRIVDDLRTVYGSHHIPYHGSIREILKKIKNNKNLCILIDQHMKSGLPVKFFNRPVWCTHIASVLMRRTGVKVIPGSSLHRNGKIKVCYEEPLNFVTDKDSLKADFINTQKQMNWLESKIKNKPDEWFWMHNFWKSNWPAVFIDRDGTINKDYGYVASREKLEFLPGAMEALRKLRKAGYLLVVVTNQSGIARGYYTENDYFKLNEYFLSQLESEGVIIDRVYHCPHHPDSNCYYRKPNPGMIFKAMDELNIDLKRSFVIGDKASDIELGKRLKIKTIMVMTGYGKDDMKKISSDFKANDLLAAAELIIET